MSIEEGNATRLDGASGGGANGFGVWRKVAYADLRESPLPESLAPREFLQGNQNSILDLAASRSEGRFMRINSGADKPRAPQPSSNHGSTGDPAKLNTQPPPTR